MINKTSLFREILQKKLKALNYTRLNTDNLFYKNRLTNRDVNQIYAGLLLNAYICFEILIRDLFLALLIKSSKFKSDAKHNSKIITVTPRVVVNSYKIAYDIMKGPNNKFINWLPYENTKKMADIYFSGGRPFSLLTQNDTQQLTKITIIRNVIAHKSNRSLKRFEEEVIANINVPVKERQVAYYLRGIYRRSPSQTRYENLISQILNISYKISG